MTDVRCGDCGLTFSLVEGFDPVAFVEADDHGLRVTEFGCPECWGPLTVAPPVPAAE